MVEYVKQTYYTFKLDNDTVLYKIIDFANFLSQQPNIGMFVPAVLEDGEWKILSEPKDFRYLKEVDIYFNQYQTALDNVIFEGWEFDLKTSKIIGISNIITQIWFYKDNVITVNAKKVSILEDLTKHNLTLTPKFAKELGLI
jgi:hypothetical protein